MKLSNLFTTVSQLVAENRPQERDFFLEDVFESRALTAENAPSGGFTVGESVGPVAAALRPHSLALSIGCSMITTIGSGRSIPVLQQGATAAWLSETGEAQLSELAFGSFKPTAKRCAGVVKVSKQLLTQAPVLAEAALRRDLYGAIGQALDTAIFSGLGGAEPLGACFNETIPAPVTFAGPITIDDLILLESTVSENFGEAPGKMAFVTSAEVRAKARKVESLTGSGIPIWRENKMIDCPAFSTPTIATNQLLYGSWEDWLVVMFGGIRLIFDPYSAKKTHQAEIYVELMADSGPVRSKSFAKSTDSAAQI